MDRLHWGTAAMREQLLASGGLAALSGIAGGDVRNLEAAGTPQARLALQVFAYQVRKTIGAYAAALGGLDALAFTGGIGENSASLRQACCQELAFPGIRLDPQRHSDPCGDRIVSTSSSPVTVPALETNEEKIVARETYRVLLKQTL